MLKTSFQTGEKKIIILNVNILWLPSQSLNMKSV